MNQIRIIIIKKRKIMIIKNSKIINKFNKIAINKIQNKMINNNYLNNNLFNIHKKIRLKIKKYKFKM